MAISELQIYSSLRMAPLSLTKRLTRQVTWLKTSIHRAILHPKAWNNSNLNVSNMNRKNNQQNIWTFARVQCKSSKLNLSSVSFLNPTTSQASRSRRAWSKLVPPLLPNKWTKICGRALLSSSTFSPASTRTADQPCQRWSIESQQACSNSTKSKTRERDSFWPRCSDLIQETDFNSTK